MQVRVRPRVCVIMRCSSEAVTDLWEAMNVQCSRLCTACIYRPTRAVFFHVFLKFKRGMPAVSSKTTSLRVYMLQNYSAVILVLAVRSLKIKQMVNFFGFAIVERLLAE